MVWLVGLLLPVVLLKSLLVLTWIVRLIRLRLRMRGEPFTSSSVMLSVLFEVSFFLIGERAGLKSPELGRPAVVGEVETSPAQLLTELAETCYLQLVVMLEDPL